MSTQQQKKRNYKIQNPRSLQQDNKASMYIICGIFFICTAWRVHCVYTVKTEKKTKSRFKHFIFLVSVCGVRPNTYDTCVFVCIFLFGLFFSLANKQIHIKPPSIRYDSVILIYSILDLLSYARLSFDVFAHLLKLVCRTENTIFIFCSLFSSSSENSR